MYITEGDLLGMDRQTVGWITDRQTGQCYNNLYLYSYSYSTVQLPVDN